MPDEIASLIEFKEADDSLAKYVLEELQRHYPDHPWHVQAISSQGQIIIRNPSLSRKFCMRMILPKVVNHGDFQHKIMEFGGQFLERHGVPRNRADRDQVQMLWKKSGFK